MNIVEGKNAVIEALVSGRQIEKILSANDDGRIIAYAKKNGVTVQSVPKAKLDELSETKKHQGVIAIVASINYSEPEDILKYAHTKNEKPLIVILDHISDPHNLGAIIRTAEAAGAHGVIIPKRRAAAVTPVAEKASAGAASHIPIARVSNIAACIDKLKDDGVWIYCATADGKSLYECDMNGPAAIVIGSEGEGVKGLVRQKSDFHISIPMFGKISSLNASVAAGVVLYEAVRQRLK